MNKIHKYTLDFPNQTTLLLPKFSAPLSVMNQHENLVLYALIDTEETQKDKWAVKMIMTGEEFNETSGDVLIGTVSFSNGTFVVHVFIRYEGPENENAAPATSRSGETS